MGTYRYGLVAIKEVKQVKIALMILLLLVIVKWLMCRLSIAAILLYYIERDLLIPDHDTIQEYRIKVVEKSIDSWKWERNN